MTLSPQEGAAVITVVGGFAVTTVIAVARWAVRRRTPGAAPDLPRPLPLMPGLPLEWEKLTGQWAELVRAGEQQREALNNELIAMRAEVRALKVAMAADREECDRQLQEARDEIEELRTRVFELQRWKDRYERRNRGATP